MDCKKSRVILDARQLKRITEIVRNASRPLSARYQPVNVCNGKYSSSNPEAMACTLSLKPSWLEGRSGREIGDILNSLQGKRSKNKHIQALLKLLTPKLAQFDSKLSMIDLSRLCTAKGPLS
jgi:hypothetical protein